MKSKGIVFLLAVVLGCSGCSAVSNENMDNDKKVDYSEEYEVSEYGNEEKLNSLADVMLVMENKEFKTLNDYKFVLENNTDKDYRYDEYYTIEAEQSGVWYQLNQLEEPENEKQLFLKSAERIVIEPHIQDYYGALPRGKYRIVKPITFFESERDWDYDTYYISVEFEIK